MRTTLQASITPIIQNNLKLNKPPLLASVAMYIDSMDFSFSRAPRSELLGSLRRHCRTVLTGKVCDDNDPSTVWCHLLKLDKPSPEAMRILDRYMREANHKVGIYRLHIALDFDPMPGVTREEVIEFVKTAIHLRYSRDCDYDIEIVETWYRVEANGRKTRISRQAVRYFDKDGALDGEGDKIHYEVRLEIKRAVLACGVKYPADTFAIDPRAFAARYLKIADHRPILTKIIPRVIAATIKAYPHPHVDIARRVQSHARRQWQTLTGFKRNWPRQYERLKPWDVLSFGSELEWVQAPKPTANVHGGVNEGVGKLMPLSQALPSDPQSSGQIRPVKRRKVKRVKL